MTIIVCLLAAEDSLAGSWLGRAPDPVGRSEAVELRFIASESGYAGALRVPDGEIPLQKIHLQGRVLTFEATRQLRGRREVYHYEGAISGNSIDFSVQNDDGSSFLRFTARRSQ